MIINKKLDSTKAAPKEESKPKVEQTQKEAPVAIMETTKSAKKYFTVKAPVEKRSAEKEAEKNEVVVKTQWGEISIPASSIKSWRSNLPMLPFNMFLTISGYLQWCALEKKAEGRVDLTLINGEWQMVCFHQKATGSADVTVDFTQEENIALMTEELDKAFKKVHCTVHSHTDFSAFQSGTDQEDEMDKQGWHFTLGTYGSGKVDRHARYTVRESAKFNEEGEKISPALNFFFEVSLKDIVEKPKFQGIEVSSDYITEDIFNLVSKFPEEWKERFMKKEYSYSITVKGNRYDLYDDDDIHYMNYTSYQQKIHGYKNQTKNTTYISKSEIITKFEALTQLDFIEFEKAVDALTKENMIMGRKKYTFNGEEEITTWLLDNIKLDKYHMIPTPDTLRWWMAENEAKLIQNHPAVDIAERIISK